MLANYGVVVGPWAGMLMRMRRWHAPLAMAGTVHTVHTVHTAAADPLETRMPTTAIVLLAPVAAAAHPVLKSPLSVLCEIITPCTPYSNGNHTVD